MNMEPLYVNYSRCGWGVSRAGEYQPCDKPAVAARLDENDPRPYPVCVHHCRVGHMVTLAVLLGFES